MSGRKVLKTISCGNTKLVICLYKNLIANDHDSYFLENKASGESISPNYEFLLEVINFTQGYLAAHGIKGSNKELGTGQLALGSGKSK